MGLVFYHLQWAAKHLHSEYEPTDATWHSCARSRCSLCHITGSWLTQGHTKWPRWLPLLGEPRLVWARWGVYGIGDRTVGSRLHDSTSGAVRRAEVKDMRSLQVPLPSPREEQGGQAERTERGRHNLRVWAVRTPKRVRVLHPAQGPPQNTGTHAKTWKEAGGTEHQQSR